LREKQNVLKKQRRVYSRPLDCLFLFFIDVLAF